mmetsp:Transcript_27484/g.77749  ORF Transcript_27484/g.77749 Transcript_27484/m.77749 type:complete len:202 (-) Transcript_27484:1423-2028(-)
MRHNRGGVPLEGRATCGVLLARRLALRHQQLEHCRGCAGLRCKVQRQRSAGSHKARICAHCEKLTNDVQLVGALGPTAKQAGGLGARVLCSDVQSRVPRGSLGIQGRSLRITVELLQVLQKAGQRELRLVLGCPVQGGRARPVRPCQRRQECTARLGRAQEGCQYLGFGGSLHLRGLCQRDCDVQRRLALGVRCGHRRLVL